MYALYYVAQDVQTNGQPLPTWSVYVETYPSADAAEPINGSQRWVCRLADEAKATTVAGYFQEMANR